MFETNDIGSKIKGFNAKLSAAMKGNQNALKNGVKKASVAVNKQIDSTKASMKEGIKSAKTAINKGATRVEKSVESGTLGKFATKATAALGKSSLKDVGEAASYKASSVGNKVLSGATSTASNVAKKLGASKSRTLNADIRSAGLSARSAVQNKMADVNMATAKLKGKAAVKTVQAAAGVHSLAKRVRKATS